MHWKFNSDHFTFLKFENLSSSSGIMTYDMTTLTHCGQTHTQTVLAAALVFLAAFVAAWLLGSSSMNSNSHHLII